MDRTEIERDREIESVRTKGGEDEGAYTQK